VDTGVRHKVGLELGDIDVEGTIETQRRSQGRDNLSNQPVQVGVGRALNVQVAAAHIVQGLVIKAEGAVGVLQQRVGGQDVVVRLNDGSGDLGGRGHSEGELGLAAIVDRQTFKEKRTKTRTSSTTSSVEDHEALKTGTVIGELTDAIKDKVNNLLANGVVTTGVVVGGILLARDELLGVVQLTVGASADLVNNTRLQINEDSTGNVLAGTSLREKGVEGIIATANGLVRGHLSVGLDAVLKAVKLPASVTGLDTALSDMDGKAFSHF